MIASSVITGNIVTSSICILGEMSVARQEAFDHFKRTYHHNQTIQEQKRALKEKYVFTFHGAIFFSSHY